ncbi:MAG: hypothetical protein ACT4QB_03395 [Gammaproteobacteria bacterium]
MSTALEFSSAIRALMTVLDEGPPGMIIGGVAVIALGFPRTTVVNTVDLPRTRRLVGEFALVLERPEMLITFDGLVALARGPGKS